MHLPGTPRIPRGPASRKPSRLDQADGNDGVADDAMPVVEVECQRDVLYAVANKIAGEASCRNRIVDPAREVEARFAHGVRVDSRLAGSPGQRPEGEVDGKQRGHRDALQ